MTATASTDPASTDAVRLIDRIRKLPIPFIHKTPSGPFDANSGFDIAPRVRMVVC